MWTLPKTLPSEYSSIEVVDMVGKLPINPTGGWEDFKPKRELSHLTRIILHHDAMNKTAYAKYTDEKLMSNIATSHINSKKNREKGDGGFLYHIYIRSGKVYFTNHWQAFTYGVASNNDYTVHICVAGDYFNYDTLTDADRKALHMAILIAKGTMTSYKDMKGHGELQATNCPGYSVSQISEEVLKLENEIELLESPDNQSERAYQIANQITYLYNLFAHGKTPNGMTATDEQRKWALLQVLNLETEMKRLGMLK